MSVTVSRAFAGYYIPVRAVKDSASDEEGVSAAYASFLFWVLELGHDVTNLVLNGFIVLNVEIGLGFTPFGQVDVLRARVVVLDFVLNCTERA